MDPINIPPMLAYIAAPWILWEWYSMYFGGSNGVFRSWAPSNHSICEGHGAETSGPSENEPGGPDLFIMAPIGTRMLWLNHECSHVSGLVQLWNSWICCEVVTDARCGIGCWTHSVGTRDWRLTWCFVGWCENQGPDILSAALFRTEIVTDSRLVGPPHWKLNRCFLFEVSTWYWYRHLGHFCLSFWGISANRAGQQGQRMLSGIKCISTVCSCVMYRHTDILMMIDTYIYIFIYILRLSMSQYVVWFISILVWSPHVNTVPFWSFWGLILTPLVRHLEDGSSWSSQWVEYVEHVRWVPMYSNVILG